MKKTFALILALALTLPLLACGGGGSLPVETDPAETLICRTGETETKAPAGEHDATGFCAGFGRADITPTESVPLAGYGATEYRKSQNVLDPIYATCFALRDEAGETLLLYQLDLVGIPGAFGDQVKGMVERAVNVPADHILLNYTHTHSAPDVSSSNTATAHWKTEAYKAILQAAKDAVADLDRCEKILTGATETENLNFVRRYYMENGFTSPHGTYGSGAINAHESEIDEEMRILRLVRANQPDLVIANWQCHPNMTGGSKKYDVSSDLVGQFRRFTEDELGVKLLYLQGGAGNVSYATRLPGEPDPAKDYVEKGRLLSEALKGALPGLKEIPAGPIRANKATFTATVNHADDGLVGICQKISALTNGGKREEADALAVENGLSSSFEAGSIIARASKGATEDLELNCFAIGDICITAAPFETFCQIERDLRAKSPFAFTLSCGYSNDSRGYLPASECFPNKGYEVVQCRYVQGTAEEIAARELELLNELHGN